MLRNSLRNLDVRGEVVRLCPLKNYEKELRKEFVWFILENNSFNTKNLLIAIHRFFTKNRVSILGLRSYIAFQNNGVLNSEIFRYENMHI